MPPAGITQGVNGSVAQQKGCGLGTAALTLASFGSALILHASIVSLNILPEKDSESGAAIVQQDWQQDCDGV